MLVLFGVRSVSVVVVVLSAGKHALVMLLVLVTLRCVLVICGDSTDCL